MKIDGAAIEELRNKLRSYLEGKISHFDINLWALNNIDATEEKIGAGGKSEQEENQSS